VLESRSFLAALALHFACFLALFVGWFAIAGQSGSPVPDNWPMLERMLDILGVSAWVALLLLAVAPLAAWAAVKGSRWQLVYPALLLLNAAVTVALCTVLATRDPAPAQPAFVATPHHPCWRFGQVIPAADAVGRPIRPGDLVLIRPVRGSDNPLPDTPEQAAQRKAWQGRIVMVEGTMQGDSLRFRPVGADAGRAAPQFCLWPDNVEHVRMH